MNDVMSTWRFSHERIRTKGNSRPMIHHESDSHVPRALAEHFRLSRSPFLRQIVSESENENLETRFYFFRRCFFPQERVSPSKNYGATPSSRTFIAQGFLSNSSRCDILFSVY